MKTVIVSILCLFFLLGCKEDNKDVENLKVNEIESGMEEVPKSIDGLTTIAGEFVYFADAAVLQTKTGMYGVIINSKMHELNKLAKQYKTEDTDFVPVTVRGKIMPKEEGTEGWDFNIDIKEIVKVERPNPDNEDVIKLGNN